MKAKIFHIAYSLYAGGTEKTVFTLITHNNKSKYNHKVCILGPIGDLGKRLPSTKKISFRLNSRSLMPVHLIKLINLIKKSKPKALVSYLPYENSLNVIAGKITKTPSICGWRSTSQFTNKLKLSAELFFIKRADLIISNTQLGKTELIQQGVDKKRIKVIVNGTKIPSQKNTKRKIQKQYKLPPNSIILSTIGHLHPFKGLNYLIDSMPKILKQEKKAYLLIAGNGPKKQALENQINNLNLEERIKLLGNLNHDQVIDLLLSTDIFVFPSILEGMSNALAEAMACKKPIVATNIGGNKELIKNNISGLLINAKRPGEIATACILLLQNKKLRRKLGTGARERIRTNFSIKKMVSNFENEITEVIK